MSQTTFPDRVSLVADYLERTILSGKLEPGEPLPPEREISSQMGVSRSVVREAIGRLTSLGLIKSIHGAGNRVQPPDSKQIKLGYRRMLLAKELSAQQLDDVRLGLEISIASAAAENRTDDHLERLRKAQQVLGNTKRSLQSQLRADVDFHATLAEATANPLYEIMLEPLQEVLLEHRRRSLSRNGAKSVLRHHDKILAAVENQDPVAAAEAMEEHLRVGASQRRRKKS